MGPTTVTKWFSVVYIKNSFVCLNGVKLPHHVQPPGRGEGGGVGHGVPSAHKSCPFLKLKWNQYLSSDLNMKSIRHTDSVKTPVYTHSPTKTASWTPDLYCISIPPYPSPLRSYSYFKSSKSQLSNLSYFINSID